MYVCVIAPIQNAKFCVTFYLALQNFEQLNWIQMYFNSTSIQYHEFFFNLNCQWSTNGITVAVGMYYPVWYGVYKRSHTGN